MSTPAARIVARYGTAAFVMVTDLTGERGEVRVRWSRRRWKCDAHGGRSRLPECWHARRAAALLLSAGLLTQTDTTEGTTS